MRRSKDAEAVIVQKDAEAVIVQVRRTAAREMDLGVTTRTRQNHHITISKIRIRKIRGVANSQNR